jgi:transmembrane sensor
MKADMITDLIIKSLTGSLNDKEDEHLEAWLKETESNRTNYQKIRILWEQIGNSYEKTDFNQQAAKEKIRLKIQQAHTKNRIFRHRLRNLAAASILLLIGLGIYAFFALNSDKNNYLVYQSGNRVREIALPDSSRVWLNENSRLQVVKNYSGNQRRVVLKGEAYFEIKRNETKPFKVRAGNTIVKVLGTSFNILVERTSGNVCVTVKSGKVAFYRINSLKKNFILTQGTKGQYFAGDHELKTSTNNDPNYLSWKTGMLTFNDAPLKEVCKVLSEHYKTNVKTNIGDSSLLLTGSFQNETLEEILKTIELTLDIKSKSSNGEVLLYN